MKTGKPVWNKGKKMPEWIIEKLRHKTYSDETRHKMSLAKKGKMIYDNRVRVYVYDYNGDFVGLYNSIKDACKELGIKNQNIGKVL